ncbi:MAG TPA: formate/nitrite transporter family protein [Bryobacteraceae bacterium]
MAPEELDPPDVVAPELSEREKEEAQDRTSVSATVVHETVRCDGEEELHRPVSALGWSGLAAGMSMGFSLVAMALFRAYLPDRPWRPLLVRLGYPMGFLIVIIARQQLFTENTLTAMIPLLARRDLKTLVRVIRLWTVVLVANLIGAHLFAWVVAVTPMFLPEVQSAMLALAKEAAAVTFGQAVLRGIFAGWLIAMVVWMLAAIDTGRIAVIVFMTYIVGLASLTHIIAGSVEVLFLVMVGVKSWGVIAVGYLLPTLIGNVIGGVSLTAAINHAQAVAGMAAKEPRP